MYISYNRIPTRSVDFRAQVRFFCSGVESETGPGPVPSWRVVGAKEYVRCLRMKMAN